MKNSELTAHYKQLFKDFVENLWIGEQLKKHIADDEFIEKNPSAYLYYPVMFYEAFDTKANHQEALELVAVAGYLCFRSVMQNDTELDNQGVISEKFRFPIASRVCQEECVKILASLFPLKSPFWSCWNQSKFDFLQAVNTDKQYTGEDLSISAFEKIAEYKSTFAKVAIHAAYFISESTDNQRYEILLESHRLFSVGFQLLDDIDDFKKDFVEKQINFAHISLKKVCNQKGILWDETQIELLQKQFYVQGVAEQLLDLAIEYFDKAQQIVEPLNAPLWKEVLAGKRKEALSVKLRLIAYQKTLFAKVRLSKNKQTESLSLKEAILEAKNFIISQQENNGSWVDFYHISGLSNSWATGYVLQCVSALSVPFDTLSRKRACEFLIGQRTNGLWGWNTDWIPDTDSTTCVLAGLKSNDVEIDEEFAIWKGFQQKNGGFSTYTDRDSVLKSVNYANDKVEGWMQTHVCVSALALHFLTQTDPNNHQRKALKKYILANQNSEGLWDCYWWTSPIYASYYALKSLILEQNEHDKTTIDRGVKGLLNLQQKDGSFTDSFSQNSPFYSAMVLDLLCSSSVLFQQNRIKAEALLHWLRAAQFSDGSFSSTASLQIPAPNVVDIKSVAQWERSNKATNHITDDFMRLFSTAQTLKAFDSYYQLTA